MPSMNAYPENSDRSATNTAAAHGWQNKHFQYLGPLIRKPSIEIEAKR